MSQVPPPKPSIDNTGAVVAATAAGGGVLVIILAIVAVMAVAAICVIGLLVALLLPAIQAARDSAQSVQSMNNVRQISLAMFSYKSSHRSLPLQYTVGPSGQPLHSWRTLLLPYLGQDALFNQINANEPWDSASNAQWTQIAVVLFCSPRAGKPSALTNYVVVTGDGFAFNKDHPVRPDDVKDGTSNTIFIIEIANSNISWAEPRDPKLDELNFESEGAPLNAPNLVRETTVVCFGDGSAMRLPRGTTRQELLPRLTISGGETPPSW